MKNKQAFSLVELLVVISIIVILASLLFPVLARARQSAKRIQCLNNQKQLTLAWMQYADDNNGRLVLSTLSDPIPRAGEWLQWDNTTELAPTYHNPATTVMKSPLYQYAPNPKVFLCPSCEEKSYSWADHDYHPIACTQSMSVFMGEAWNLIFNTDVHYYRTAQEINPPSVLFVFQCGPWGSFDVDMWANPRNLPGRLPSHYHPNSANFSFADGHCESHKWVDARTCSATWGGQPSPKNPDVEWMIDHATRPR